MPGLPLQLLAVFFVQGFLMGRLNLRAFESHVLTYRRPPPSSPPSRIVAVQRAASVIRPTPLGWTPAATLPSHLSSALSPSPARLGFTFQRIKLAANTTSPLSDGGIAPETKTLSGY